MLSSVSNVMLCGEGDVHPGYDGEIARLSSSARREAFGGENLAAELDGSNSPRCVEVTPTIRHLISETFRGGMLVVGDGGLDGGVVDFSWAVFCPARNHGGSPGRPSSFRERE